MSSNGFTDEQELENVKREHDEQRERWRLEGEVRDIELEKLKEHSKARDHTGAVTVLVNGFTDWAGSAKAGAIQLLKPVLALEGGGLFAVDENGARVVGPNGFKTGQEYILEFRKQNANMVRSDKPSQSQATPGEDPQTSDKHLRKLFGIDSDAKYAVRFANADLARYRQLREIARSRGIK